MAKRRPSTPTPTPSLPSAPVYFPSESDFLDPLRYIASIRPEAELAGICVIVPPPSWKPPFALNLSSFSFPTKSQSIHRLQARPPACDPQTFDLDYERFLTSRGSKRSRRRIVFEGEDLDLCRLFNAVKRFGGYEKACDRKKWGDVFRLVMEDCTKVSECSKHVLCQLYREHLFDYEEYRRKMERRTEKCKRGRVSYERKRVEGAERKRRRGKSEKEVNVVELDQICEQCRSGLHGEVMLLCDRCDKGWHLHCLSPPLDRVPAGNWYCLECVNSDGDSFGFVPGKRCSLDEFRRMNERTRRKWFGPAGASGSQMEKRFWEIVEGKAGELEVMYGSDLDTSLHGSGFPREGDSVPSSVDDDLCKEYVSSPWNLNNFPKLQGSLLRVVDDNIAGVMVPWLYIGMLFSSFCWHIEDHCFYSINYLHWGEPKCWYGVPGNKAEAFEQVMRSALPDLFDVQPDLLFQLVTMLNPSALVDNGVPVYRALQEPGNFVITFPRSYHGGFNFGLNCAEAVNFAPADWLPHGGFGAEQYQLYRKAAVLSHEELIYVVAKSGFDSKVSSYLKKELQRMFIKEKNQREMIYERGIMKSSSMPPREHPNKIGIEEDPTCIICQQYLYLSAVVCNCRPSTFVCLEHWNLLCECNCEKHRLLYRHSLAELSDLIEIECHEHNTILGPEDRLHDAAIAENGSYFVEQKCLTEKIQVIGDYSSLKQLADGWLCNARQILQIPFSNSAYASALEKAEQFLWRDHYMDVVRDMVNKLVKAQKWAVDLKMCLAKVDGSSCHTCASDRVSLAQVNDLLNVNPLPCNEPGYLKLKVYVDDATMLSIQLESTLSSLSIVTIDELESLYSKTTESPLYLAESERLANTLSSAKRWIDGVRQCCLGKRPSSVEIDTLNKFKQEMMELHIKLPEARLLLEVSREADVLVLQCQKVLASPLKMKDLELFLDGAVGVIISIPELELLRKHHHDALSWISQLHDYLDGLNDREDHSDIVMEMTGILQSGRSLKVQVDELHIAEKELIKSCCREKASKALSAQTPLEDLLQSMTDATTLHIEREEMFQQLSKNVVAALAWEDKAKFILGHMAPKSEFEDLLRISDSMLVILPSCQALQEASLFADAWETRCHPYFSSCDTTGCALDMLLKIDDLKVLISQSALLKVDTETPRKLQCLLTNVERWERKASILIIDSLSLLCMTSEELRVETDLLSRIEGLRLRIDSAIEVGVSLRFDFNDLPRLEDISLTMKWSQKVLCSCSESPLMEDINCLVEGSEQLPIALMENSLMTVLMKGVGCLKKALTLLPESQISCRCSLEAVEGFLGELEKFEIKFPVVAAQLQEVADKHKSWLEKVQSFLLTKSPEDSWSLLLKLNELGESDALACPELENVLLETKKFQKWVTHYHEIMKPSAEDFSCLPNVLTKIKQSLDRALCIYHLSRGCGANPFSVCCSSDSRDEDTFTCLSCHDRYHLSCMGPPLANAGMIHEYSCPFCFRMETGTIPKNREQPLIRRSDRPELKAFLDHFSAGEEFYFGVQVRDLVKEIASKASQCSSYLAPIVSEALDFHGNDLSAVGERLLTALKAVAVAGIYDRSDCCRLESALSKNFWKVRAKTILHAPHKPSFQRIQSMIKEGVALNVTMGDHFMCELVYVKEICLQWAHLAREIALDSGALELRRVFEVINEGENLPVYMDKEMKLLKSRSVLYCICRRPYDRRPMIACDQCNEWYHFDCIELQVSPPKIFFCPACKPLDGELLPITLAMEDEPSCIEEAPKTPPPRKNESRRTSSRKAKPSQRNAHAAVDGVKSLTCPNETYRIWRDNRRCATRTAKRRRHFESLLFFISQL